MSDPWRFWREALDGGFPETSPGTPHAGYFVISNRRTFDNPNPTVGGSRKVVKTTEEPVAIWIGDNGWQCVIGRHPEMRELTDIESIDAVFSRCCRRPITEFDYTLLSGIEVENGNQ
jgi:hypothetical protein